MWPVWPEAGHDWPLASPVLELRLPRDQPSGDIRSHNYHISNVFARPNDTTFV